MDNKNMSFLRPWRKKAVKMYTGTILSDGFGKILVSNDESYGGVSCFPIISLDNLRHDPYGYTWDDGPYTVMESMLWKEEPVTIKRLHTAPREGGHVDLLIAELEFMLQLHHPAILFLMGTCRTDNLENLILVYERVHLGSLYSYLHQKMESMSLLQICTLMKQVASALLYLHRKGFIHCYVTSHSLFLIRHDLVRVGNFEYMIHSCHPASNFSTMSSSVSANTSTTSYNVTIGNSRLNTQVTTNKYTNAAYNWMAPEVMDGKIPTEKSDLYSFCSVLWEMMHAKKFYSNPLIHISACAGTEIWPFSKFGLNPASAKH
ncbi:hypothetical protein HELRODRAFT_183141 [Helobdella robusta]|uniref:Protein kinase domain-containing protein n=1 Tax=Helobdella robusta TaxID=6412 RepID=T1FJ71_HELRO|nr:hypothetical protein HELRODRAFT_183141 [Helobdella robusta]ESO11448.1 hypothetical protein HELRODRAFT_183141 [Helobdella robusta]